jgi:hypothetical protein
MLIWTIILLATPWGTAISLASSGQIPVVNGVLGGVRDPAMGAAVPKVVAVDPGVVRSPGKVRVVENSGVCGEPFFLDTRRNGGLMIIIIYRDNAWGVPSIWLRRPHG